MLKKNEQNEEHLQELPNEESTCKEPTEDEAAFEDDFDGPINVIELENDDFDDWHSELDDEIHSISKTSSVSNTTPVYTLDKKRIINAIIPAKYICSLSKQLMTDPVRIAGSKVPVAYEKSAIEAHFDEFGTDPMTNDYLDDDVVFIPDLALKREISDFCVKQQWITESTAPQS